MLDWFASLTPTLQGVVIGSSMSIVGTTLGVVFTNAFNLWSQRKQQDHDRSQKSLERVATMRRTVYLEAAEALGAGLAMLARQGHLGTPDADLSEPFTSKAPALSKVYLTANVETATALAKYSADFQRTLLTLGMARNKAMALRHKILDIKKSSADQTAQANQMVELQKRWYIEADGNKDKHTAMGHAAEYHNAQATAFSQNAESLIPGLKEQHLWLLDTSQKESHRLIKELLPFIAAVRKELELPIDEDQFGQIFQFSKAVPQEKLKELLGIETPSS